MGDEHGQEEAPRKKFVFKKRDPAEAARLEAERLSNVKKNPFGDAKPREAVIAERTGKDEKDVLTEAASEYQVKLRLTPEQYAEKKERLDEIFALKEKLEGEPEDLEAIKADITEKEASLAKLTKGFEDLLIAKAKAGELPRPQRKMEGDGPPGRGGFQDGFDGGPRGGGRPNRGGFYDDAGGGGGDEQAGLGFPNYNSGRRGGGGFTDRGAGGYQEAGGGAFQDRRGGGGGGGAFEDRRGGGGGGFDDRRGGGGGDERRGGGGGGAFQDRRGGGGSQDAPRGGNRDFGSSGGGGGGGGEQYPMGADDYRPLHER